MSAAADLISNDYQIKHGTCEKRMSTFSKFLCMYTREIDSFTATSVKDKQKSKFLENWDKFQVYLEKANFDTKENGSSELTIPFKIAEEFTNLNGIDVKVTEFKKDGENQVRGIITSIEAEDDFGNWFIYHILNMSRLDMSENSAESFDNDYHEKLADFFAENLKNTIVNDKWLEGGRDHFVERLKYFTSRNIKVECILPAFPCKSSNIEKVGGTLPDMGEFIALKRLVKAAKDASQIYSPGMKFWIVSDGHVFSDCIGVDDEVVDTYTEELHKQYQMIKETDDKEEHIGFFGLKDIFHSGESGKLYNTSWANHFDLPHFTGTKIEEKSEVSRKIMMLGCDTDDGRLEEQVKIPGHPRLFLYRGFAKFMEEDLKRLPYFAQFSRKQFKKTASRVAFEMIKRNDAYSNLVDLVFPHHMRLSIHAHPNSGPKFGIKVISDEQCRVVKSLENNEAPVFEDFLHIPTPWHNTVVYISNQNQYFLTRSTVVKKAIKNGFYNGSWVTNSGVGYFHITKIPGPVPYVDGSSTSVDEDRYSSLSKDSSGTDIWSENSRNTSFSLMSSELNSEKSSLILSRELETARQTDADMEKVVSKLKKEWFKSAS